MLQPLLKVRWQVSDHQKRHVGLLVSPKFSALPTAHARAIHLKPDCCVVSRTDVASTPALTGFFLRSSSFCQQFRTVRARKPSAQKCHYDYEHNERDPEQKPPQSLDALRLNACHIQGVLISMTASGQNQQKRPCQ